MKKNAKRLLLIAVMLFLLTACGNKEDPAAPEPKEWVYVPEFITMEGDYIDYSGIALSKDNLLYLSMEWEEGLQCYTQHMGTYSLSQRKASTVPLAWPEESSGMSLSKYVFGADGSLFVMAKAYPTGPPASGASPEIRIFLCKFDSRGECLFTRNITEDLQDTSGQQPYISLMKTDGSGRIYLLGDACLWLYDQDGTFSGRISPDAAEVWMNELYHAGNDKMYLSMQTPGVEGRSFSLYEVDFENKKLAEVWTDFPGGNVFVSGIQNDLLMQDRVYAYTFDLAEKKAQELFRWMDCDINGNDVLYFGEMDDSTIVAVTENSNRQGEIALLTKTDPDEAAQKESLVLAVLTDAYNYEPAVVKFNRASSQYHITIREYRNLEDGSTNSLADALARLYADLASDNCPDLIELTGLDAQRLAAKGLCEDLRPFFEKSSLINTEDFVNEIVEAYTFDGTLASVPILFFLETVMGHSAQLGTEPGWTFDELTALAKAYPGAELFDGATKSDILRYVLTYNYNAFIDWSAGTCSFDSPEFQSILQFAASFPDQTVPDPDRPDTPARIQSGEVLLKNTFLYDFDSIQMDMAMYGEDAVCIGFPTTDGTPRHGLTTAYAYAIPSKSHNQEGAWSFIENVLAEEENARNQMGFPSMKRRLEAMMADALQEEYVLDENGDPYLDENGNPIVTGTQTTSGNGWSYTYHTATKQEADTILSLLKGSCLASGYESREIMGIISEEAEAFFAGQKSLSETISVIQSRMNLYVNENR